MKHTLSVSLALLTLATAMLLAACGTAPNPAGPSSATVILPKPADASAITQSSQIIGVWQVSDPQCNPAYMIFRRDGTYMWSCSPDGSTGLSGKYHFSDGKLVVLNEMCGAAGQYRVDRASVGANTRALNFTVIQDSCSAEIQTLTTQSATWVSPAP